MAASQFSMYSGDTRTVVVAIKNKAGAPVAVNTAESIIYNIFNEGGTALLAAPKILTAGITVGGTDNNIVTVTLDPADTEDIDTSGFYIHEMQITLATGEVCTVLQGKMEIMRDYIHE